MEATRQFAPKPWQWPNILSLDAPIIAVAWQALLTHSLGVRVNRLEPVVLALSVWLVYIADQLLDALKPAAEVWEPARKVFYRQHFRLAAAVAISLGAVILPLAYLLLRPAAFLGGLQLATGVLLYFGAVHATPLRWRGLWPREAAVALLFALGTFLGVWSATGEKVQLLAMPTLLFAFLCWANCAAIETWEWQVAGAPVYPPPGASTRWATRHLGYVGVAVVAAALAARLTGLAPAEFASACALSGATLSLLWFYRARLAPDSVSAVADLALCSPFFALLFQWGHDWVR